MKRERCPSHLSATHTASLRARDCTSVLKHASRAPRRMTSTMPGWEDFTNLAVWRGVWREYDNEMSKVKVVATSMN